MAKEKSSTRDFIGALFVLLGVAGLGFTFWWYLVGLVWWLLTHQPGFHAYKIGVIGAIWFIVGAIIYATKGRQK